MHFIAKIIDVLLKHYLNVNSRSELRIATFMRSVRIFFSFDEFTFFNASTVNPPLPPQRMEEDYDVSKGLECGHLTLTCHLFKGSVN